MHTKIMVPIDLRHPERLNAAIDRAAELAKLSRADLVFVGATGTAPSDLARSPEYYAEKLEAFAAEHARSHDIYIGTRMVVDHDPAADLPQRLIDAAGEMGADLIVMASHRPGPAEHIVASNAGYVASHAPISVYVVR